MICALSVAILVRRSATERITENDKRIRIQKLRCSFNDFETWFSKNYDWSLVLGPVLDS